MTSFFRWDWPLSPLERDNSFRDGNMSHEDILEKTNSLLEVHLFPAW